MQAPMLRLGCQMRGDHPGGTQTCPTPRSCQCRVSLECVLLTPADLQESNLSQSPRLLVLRRYSDRSTRGVPRRKLPVIRSPSPTEAGLRSAPSFSWSKPWASKKRTSALKRGRAARARSLRGHTDSRLDLDIRRREADTSFKKSNTYCSGFETRLSTHVNSIASVSANMKWRKTTPICYGRDTLPEGTAGLSARSDWTQ